MKSKLFTILAVGAMLAMPLFVGAQQGGLGTYNPTTGSGFDPNVSQETQVGGIKGLSTTYSLVIKLVGYLVALFWILTVVFFILAAIQYLTAQGDPEKAKKAKKMVTYGIIAVVVALFSTAIRALVLNALTGV